MSQLPQIKIADLLQYKIGWLIARISEVSSFQAVSKYTKPPNSTVNVYKLKLIDETGEIEYQDWCKKPNVERTYKKGQIIKFAHAKLKISQNIDPNTGQPFPPRITTEPKAIVELLDENGQNVIAKTIQQQQIVASPPNPITLPPASLPTVAQPITPAIPGPTADWLSVKAQYPVFYNTVDELFNLIYKLLSPEQQIFVDQTYKRMMDYIWGSE